MRRFVLCLFVSCSILSAASLRGSRASQEKQNREADREKLSRIEDDAQLERLKKGGLLVKLPETKTVIVDERLESKWRWCRRWTTAFLRDLGREYYAKFHEPIQVNSAVRTVEYQNALRKRNGNATSANGKRRSSHLTGATIDLAKRDMSSAEKKWIRRKLLDLEKRNLIEATEEGGQPCFHVMVFKNYRDSSLP